MTYYHQNKKSWGEVIPLEEDEDWILGVAEADERGFVTRPKHANVYCKVCMWYVGHGEAAGHSFLPAPCIKTDAPMNEVFVKKALLLVPK